MLGPAHQTLEGVLDHVDFDAGDGGDVEADPAPAIVGLQPLDGQRPDLELLAPVHRLRSRPEAVRASRLDLAEHDLAVAEQDQVQLARANPPVLIQDLVAGLAVPASNLALTPSAAGLLRTVRGSATPMGGTGLGVSDSAFP